MCNPLSDGAAGPPGRPVPSDRAISPRCGPGCIVDPNAALASNRRSLDREAEQGTDVALLPKPVSPVEVRRNDDELAPLGDRSPLQLAEVLGRPGLGGERRLDALVLQGRPHCLASGDRLVSVLESGEELPEQIAYVLPLDLLEVLAGLLRELFEPLLGRVSDGERV